MLFARFAAKAHLVRAVMGAIEKLVRYGCFTGLSIFCGAAGGFRACGRGQRAPNTVAALRFPGASCLPIAPLPRKRLAFSASGGASPLSLWNPAAFVRACLGPHALPDVLFSPDKEIWRKRAAACQAGSVR